MGVLIEGLVNFYLEIVMKKNIVKTLFFSSISILTVLIILIVFIARNRSSGLNVVFVNIPNSVSDGISAQILRKTERPPVFKTLSSDGLDIQKLSKRTDIIFSYNGEFGTEISAFAKEIPSSILQTVPENFLQTQNALPILLEHYGIFYYNSAKQKASASYAFDFSEFELYLQKTKNVTEFPLFVSGGDDLRLLAFVGTLTESVFGQEAYTEFLNALKNYSTMENLLQVKISSDKTVKDAFGIIIDFQKKAYLHPAWLGATIEDFKNYALDSRFSVAFASLSDFRTLGSALGQGFSMDRMPILDAKTRHGIIAPVIQGFCLSEKKEAMELLEFFSEIDVETELSNSTMLAPASAFASSCDKEADDVRFLASACPAGPLCDPFTAVFESDYKRGNSFCRDLRFYFKSFQ